MVSWHALHLRAVQYGLELKTSRKDSGPNLKYLQRGKIRPVTVEIY